MCSQREELPEVLHRPRNLFCAEVVSVSDLQGAPRVVKRVPGTNANLLRRVLVRARLWHESHMLCRLSRTAPGVAPAVLNCAPDNFSMEFLPGETFHAIKACLSERPEILQQLEQTLDRLHGVGVAHGEIRLGNLLESEGRVYLLDFETAVSACHPLFSWVRILDRFALGWIREHVFGLKPCRRDLDLRDRHTVLYRLFLLFWARDIPFG